MPKQYRVNIQVRRRGEAALAENKTEFKSEDYLDDEELGQAINEEVVEILRQDREWLEQNENEDDTDSY